MSDHDLDKFRSEDRDFAGNGQNHEHLHADMDPDHALRKVQTAGSISISPELFEKMYLSPQNKVSGDLRRTFGNPTPIGLGGFLVAYSPIIFELLGWRGYNTIAAATVGTYYFSGGLLAIIASIMEWVLGNSFPATFFAVFGGYFLSYGTTITPSFGAYAAYDPSNPTDGMKTPEYLSGIAFWNIMVGIFTVYCTICAVRTNVLFCLAFFFLSLTFLMVGGSFWIAEEQKTVLQHKVQLAGASCGFITMVIGWYILLALMLSTVDFPFNLPVGDLSVLVKGYSQRQKAKKEKDVEKQN